MRLWLRFGNLAPLEVPDRWCRQTHIGRPVDRRAAHTEADNTDGRLWFRGSEELGPVGTFLAMPDGKEFGNPTQERGDRVPLGRGQGNGAIGAAFEDGLNHAGAGIAGTDLHERADTISISPFNQADEVNGLVRQAGDGLSGRFRRWNISTTKHGAIEPQRGRIMNRKCVEAEVLVAYGKGQRGVHGRNNAHRQFAALDLLKNTANGRCLTAQNDLAGGIDNEDRDSGLIRNGFLNHGNWLGNDHSEPIHWLVRREVPVSASGPAFAGEFGLKQGRFTHTSPEAVVVRPGTAGQKQDGFAQTEAQHGVRLDPEAAYEVGNSRPQSSLAEDEVAVVVGMGRHFAIPEQAWEKFGTRCGPALAGGVEQARPACRKLPAHPCKGVAHAGEDEGHVARDG